MPLWRGLARSVLCSLRFLVLGSGRLREGEVNSYVDLLFSLPALPNGGLVCGDELLFAPFLTLGETG